MVTGNVGIFKLDKRSYGVMIESDVKMTGNVGIFKLDKGQLYLWQDFQKPHQ